MVYNNPMDLELNIPKYGPTKNIDINQLITMPKKNIPPAASALNRNPENPNTVNTSPIRADTTNAMATVMIINPK